MADRPALNKNQRAALIEWWKYKDRYRTQDTMPPTVSYQTLVALERRGLIANLGREGWGGATPGGWKADVTEEGRKLAEQLAQGSEATM